MHVSEYGQTPYAGREIRTHQQQKLHLFKEYAIVNIGECMLRYSRLFRLPLMAAAAVFVNVGMDTAFCSSNVQLAP